MITRRIAQLAELVHQETGKPHGDAMLEVALAIDHLDWAATHAEKVLGRRKVSSGLVMANQAATVEYQPLGVVGVIGPWNYPVFTPMGSIGYALAAGNAVVFKPSEYTPGVGEWLAATFSEVVPDHPVLQVVTGLGETGAALCRAGVDKLAFTGSTATGKKVMAACAETLTPVVIEAGGKDARDRRRGRRPRGRRRRRALGRLSNAGQTCIGVERVYVDDRVYDEFLATLIDKAREVTAARGSPDSKIGPITMPSQLGRHPRAHRRRARPRRPGRGRWRRRGGRAVRAADRSWSTCRRTPRRCRRRPSARPSRSRKVRDMDEAVERTNAHPLRAGLDGVRARRAAWSSPRGSARA